MIDRLRKLAPDLYVALGPKFDRSRVLVAMCRFVHAFIEAHRETNPLALGSVHLDGGRSVWNHEDTLSKALVFYGGIGAYADVDDTPLVIDVEMWRFRLQPMGSSILFETAAGPRTIEEAHWCELDPSPCLTICRNPAIDPVPADGGPRADILMSETQRKIVGLMLDLHANLGFDARRAADGLVLQVAHVILSHAKYGLGLGTLRIPCLT